MVIRREQLTPEEEACAVSAQNAKHRMQDPEFVAMLRERMADQDAADEKPPRLTREEFLAKTKP